MIDKRPLLIAQCVDVADVVAAVNFGRDNGLLVAIRGGGHNGPGLGSVDDGLVIDLSMMKGVRVDPANRTVRVEPGCTSGDVDHATHAFGLAVPFGIVSTTGVAGLTLGGGSGYLTRKHGLTIDNLLEADVVLADGSFVTASPKENADLFWALRGGGGNFGVVTSFLFQAHPVKHGLCRADLLGRQARQGDHGGLPRLPADRAGGARRLRRPEDGALDGPVPARGLGQARLRDHRAFNGSEEDGKKALAPLLDKLPEPFFNWMGVMPFPAMQGLFDVFFPKGLQWYWKGDFVTDLPDEAIEVYVAESAKAPSELCLMHLYPIDGAVRRVGKDATAWSARDATWSMVIAGIDSNPQQAGALTRWGRGLLGCGAPVQPRRRLRQLHDGRRRRGARAGELRRQLRAARGGEEAVRPGQPVPREPEHQAGAPSR